MKTHAAHRITRFLPLGICLGLLITPIALATDGITGRDFSRISGSENVYAFSGSAIVDESLTGDAYVIANTISVDNPVTGDVGFVGNIVDINNRVNGDIRAVANILTVNSAVSGELITAASLLNLTKSGTIEKRVIAYAENTAIRGTVKGNVHFYGETLSIHGQINGDVRAKNPKQIIIHPDAVVKGEVRYIAEDGDVLTVLPGATVSTVRYEPFEKDGSDSALADILYNLIFLLVTGFLAFGLFRKRWSAHIPVKFGDSVINIAIGLATLPAAFVITLISLAVPGMIIMAVALVFIIAALLLFGAAATPIIVGSLIESTYMKKTVVSWRSVSIGAGALLLLSLIPVIVGIIVILCALYLTGKAIRQTVTKCFA